MVNKFNQCLKTNKQTKYIKQNKNKTENNTNKNKWKKHMRTHIIEHKNTTYVDIHPGPGKELVCKFFEVKRVP